MNSEGSAGFCRSGSPGVRAVPVDRVSVRTEALVGGCGAEWKQEAEQQQQRRPPAALHVRLLGAPRPGQHPRLFCRAGPRTGSKRIKGCAAAGVRRTCALQRAPCAHGCLLISIQYQHRSPASFTSSSGSQLSLTGPNPPTGFLQEQQHRTDSSMSGPSGSL